MYTFISIGFSLFLIAVNANATTESFKIEFLSDGRKVIVTRDEVIPYERTVKNCDSTVSCLRASGWRYIAPVPKSPQAGWGNYDRRTTWWYGRREKSGNEFSESVPRVKLYNKVAVVSGDGINNKNRYRNGGSPSRPSSIEQALCVNCKNQ